MTKVEREAVERAVAWLTPLKARDSERLQVRARVALAELTAVLRGEPYVVHLAEEKKRAA